MIKLTKGPKPIVLEENETLWKTQLMSHIQNNTPIPPSLSQKYNHDEVKSALKKESHDKCMYCESKVAHITYEHIEHIKPKAKNKYPELTFTWENLGLACPRCNMNKTDEFDDNMPFINPYLDAPHQYFVAGGPYIFPVNSNHKADLTIKQIKLNRAELIEKRVQKINEITNLITVYSSLPEGTLKDITLKELCNEANKDKEYSFIIKAYLKLQKINLP